MQEEQINFACLPVCVCVCVCVCVRERERERERRESFYPLKLLLWRICVPSKKTYPQWLPPCSSPEALFIFFFNFFFNFLDCSGFCHTLKWNSHGFTCVPHPDPPSHLPLHPIPPPVALTRNDHISIWSAMRYPGSAFMPLIHLMALPAPDRRLALPMRSFLKLRSRRTEKAEWLD